MNDTPEEPADLSGLEVKDSSTKAQAAEAEQATKALVQAVADLKAENADLRDRNLRIIAEMENFRRRAERDKAEGVKYAASEFGRDMVSVADNLRRAIEAASKDAVEQNPALKALLEGIEERSASFSRPSSGTALRVSILWARSSTLITMRRW